jgi:hypothetical protein
VSASRWESGLSLARARLSARATDSSVDSRICASVREHCRPPLEESVSYGSSRSTSPNDLAPAGQPRGSACRSVGARYWSGSALRQRLVAIPSSSIRIEGRPSKALRARQAASHVSCKASSGRAPIRESDSRVPAEPMLRSPARIGPPMLVGAHRRARRGWDSSHTCGGLTNPFTGFAAQTVSGYARQW